MPFSFQWKIDLEEILDYATNDTDQWVSTVGTIMRNFPSEGTLNLNVDDSCPFLHEIISDLKKLGLYFTKHNIEK